MTNSPWLERVKALDKFRVIIVTGCHRSGTRFVSKVIAKELNRQFIGEEEIGYKLSKRALEVIGKNTCVVHGPGLFPYLKDFNKPDTVFVYVNRPTEEIQRSNKSTGVAENRYTPEERKKEWKEKPLKNKAELAYHDFESHPMWVDQKERDIIRGQIVDSMKLRELLHETEWGKSRI